MVPASRCACRDRHRRAWQRRWAQTWPSKPIRAIVPFGAGSATDIVPRIVFDPLSAAARTADHRREPGRRRQHARHRRGRQGRPRRYTLLATSSAHTITPAVYASLTYDAAADFAAVTPFGSVANVLVISPAKGFKTIQEMIAAAKAKPGSFNYASVGVGSATHLSVERLKPQRRIRSGARAVPRRPRGAHRGDGGARGILLLPAQHGAAVRPRGQAAGARGQQH